MHSSSNIELYLALVLIVRLNVMSISHKVSLHNTWKHRGMEAWRQSMDMVRITWNQMIFNDDDALLFCCKGLESNIFWL